MADIFVSYARNDKERIRGLVEALEGEGFTVWWDSHIKSGKKWPEELEREVNAAKAVLVIWTSASKGSDWVREEASEALAQNKLVPLVFEENAIPFGFRSIHAEDFTSWQGDRKAECWERLLAQAAALVGQTHRVTAVAEVRSGKQVTSDGDGGSPLTLALAALSVGGFIGAIAARDAVLGGGFAIAGLFLMLFRAADTQLPLHLKAMAGRWLLPQEDNVRVNVAEAFNTLFETVFGRRHLSFKCLWRSAFASTFFFFAILVFALLFVPTVRTAFENEYGTFLLTAIGTFVLANMVGDYVSLYQTRIFLRWLVRTPQMTVILVVADAILTLIIYLLALYVVASAIQVYGPDMDASRDIAAEGTTLPELEAESETLKQTRDATQSRSMPSFLGFYQGLIPQLSFDGIFPHIEAGRALWAQTWVLIFSIMTTFITSVWLWLVLVAGPFARPLLSGRGGVSWLGHLVQVERIPFTVFGSMVAILLVLIAVPISLYWPEAQPHRQETVSDVIVGIDPQDKASWETARAADTVEDYEAYLEAYPQGEYAELARIKIDNLNEIARLEAEAAERAAREQEQLEAEQDKAAWDTADAMGTIEAYQDYLTQNPSGLYIQAATQAIADLEAEAAAEQQRLAGEASKFAPGRVFRDCEVCPEMVVVPAGSFQMGDLSGDGSADEKPVRTVTIAEPFAVGRFEVTFKEWQACVDDGGCEGYRPSDQGWGRANRSVINVSWNHAKAYVAWLSRKTGHSYRLLTEAEWEYAARAGTKTKYAFGDTITTRQANFDGDNYLEQTVPVGSYAANGFGLYDMHGNVWEWVEDCWNDSYSGAPRDGSAWTTGNCDVRVLRGGSWLSNPSLLRSANRSRDSTMGRFNYNGFRISRTLP